MDLYDRAHQKSPVYDIAPDTNVPNILIVLEIGASISCINFIIEKKVLFSALCYRILLKICENILELYPSLDS